MEMVLGTGPDHSYGNTARLDHAPARHAGVAARDVASVGAVRRGAWRAGWADDRPRDGEMSWLIPAWLKRAVAWAMVAAVALLGAWGAAKRDARLAAKKRTAERKSKTLNEVMEKQDDARKASDDDLADRLSRH